MSILFQRIKSLLFSKDDNFYYLASSPHFRLDTHQMKCRMEN